MSSAFVVAMGVGTVFIGLIALIILVKIMTSIIGVLFKDRKKDAGAAVVTGRPADASPAAQTVIPDKGAFVAAVSAAIAEDLGEDVSRIRIHSIKKL